jgi:hypothetical protein
VRPCRPRALGANLLIANNMPFGDGTKLIPDRPRLPAFFEEWAAAYS